jgi:hypothetical protein
MDVWESIARSHMDGASQTAECLVIGEILMDTMIVAINKVDLLPDGQVTKYSSSR